MSVRGWLLRRTSAVLAAWTVLLLALPSCLAIGQGLKYLGERVIQLGGGAVVGGLSWLFYPIGFLGAMLAAGTGALWAALMAPRPVVQVDAHGNPVAGSGGSWLDWKGLLLGALLYALFRAWGHYPAIFGSAWETAKSVTKSALGTARTTARGLLGGRIPR
jgi:hypothetical protein